MFRLLRLLLTSKGPLFDNFWRAKEGDKRNQITQRKPRTRTDTEWQKIRLLFVKFFGRKVLQRAVFGGLIVLLSRMSMLGQQEHDIRGGN